MSRRMNGLAVLAGTLVLGAALPRLLPIARRALRGIGGMTYAAAATGGPRPTVDPAAAKVA